MSFISLNCVEIGMGTLGFDCLVIPGAKVGTASATLNAAGAERFCGESKGLATLAAGDDGATASKTICSKNLRFYWIKVICYNYFLIAYVYL